MNGLLSCPLPRPLVTATLLLWLIFMRKSLHHILWYSLFITYVARTRMLYSGSLSCLSLVQFPLLCSGIVHDLRVCWMFFHHKWWSTSDSCGVISPIVWLFISYSIVQWRQSVAVSLVELCDDTDTCICDQVTSYDDSQSETSADTAGHLALNYWMYPPDGETFEQPYKDNFWPQRWAKICASKLSSEFVDSDAGTKLGTTEWSCHSVTSTASSSNSFYADLVHTVYF